MNPPDDSTLDTLFATPQRLGWIYRKPSPPLQHPWRQVQVTALQLPQAPNALAIANRTYLGGVVFALGTGITLLLLLFNALTSSDPQSADGGLGLLYFCGLCAAAVLFVTSLEQRHRMPATLALGGVVIAPFVLANIPLVSGLLFIVAVAALCIGLPAIMIVHGTQLRKQAESVEAEWVRRRDQLNRDYTETMATREKKMKDYEADERTRWRTEPLWHQVSLTPAAQVLTVVGGSSYGWEALMTTLGTSLLAEGRAVTLLNFSERTFAAELCALAAYRGFKVDAVAVPNDLDGASLLAGFGPDELAGLLADALHAGEEKPDRKMTVSDRDILGKVCERLDQRPLSIERVRAGLRVILRSEPWYEGSSLDKLEYEAIRKAFGDDIRQRTNLLQNALDIERQLGALAGLATQLGTTAAPPVVTEHDLQVFELRRENEALDNEYVVDLLFQLLLRAFRRGGPSVRPNHTIVIAGADRLRNRHLKDLARFTDRTSIRLIYLFEHYGPDARQLVGRGGGCAAFMELGNDEDARGVADFIGREHKFLVTSLTKNTSRAITHNDSVTETEGQSTNYNPVFFGLLEQYMGRGSSRSWGVTRGTAETFTEGTATGEQLVYNLQVEPVEIQRLPPTSFFYVQVEAGDRQIILGDCNPDIASLPRVARSAPQGELGGRA